MPIIQSAKKRVRVAKKATARNAKTKRNLKEAVKSLQKAAKSGKKSFDKELKQAQSTIDKAVKKGVLHKNKASRKKSQLARLAKATGSKPPAKKVSPAQTSKKKVSAGKPKK